MKLKRYLCVFMFAALALCGCGGEKSGETTAAPGKVVDITADALLKKVNDKEDFALVFTQTTCGHCETFLKMMESYMKNHNVVLYIMVLDKESDVDKALKKLKEPFPEFTSTPDIYYVEKGVIKSRFWSEFQEKGLDAETFHEWVMKYGLMTPDQEK